MRYIFPQPNNQVISGNSLPDAGSGGEIRKMFPRASDEEQLEIFTGMQPVNTGHSPPGWPVTEI